VTKNVVVFALAVISFLTGFFSPAPVAAQTCMLDTSACIEAVRAPCSSMTRQWNNSEGFVRTVQAGLRTFVRQQQVEGTNVGIGASYGLSSGNVSVDQSHSAESLNQAIQTYSSAVFSSMTQSGAESSLGCEANLIAFQQCIQLIVSACANPRSEFSLNVSEPNPHSTFQVSFRWHANSPTSHPPRFESRPFVVQGATCTSTSARPGRPLTSDQMYLFNCQRGSEDTVMFAANTTASDVGLRIGPVCGALGDRCCLGGTSPCAGSLTCNAANNRCETQAPPPCESFAGNWRLTNGGTTLGLAQTGCEVTGLVTTDPPPNSDTLHLMATGNRAMGTIHRIFGGCITDMATSWVMSDPNHFIATDTANGCDLHNYNVTVTYERH
jgi:hypothetical protein